MPIELNTIDDCKDGVAKKDGFTNWMLLIESYIDESDYFGVDEKINEAMKLLAEHLLDYAAQEAKTKALDGLPYSDIIVVDTDSITNIKNKIK